MKKSYRDLFIWQAGVGLAAAIIKCAERFPAWQRSILAEQMCRAAVSVPSNIAEGWGRTSRPEFRRFLHIARASLCELQTQLEIAHLVDLLSGKELSDFTAQARKVGVGINRLIRYLNSSTT